MNDTYKIRTLGGALVVTLPQRLVRQYALKPKDEVALVAFDKKHIIIEILSKAKPKNGAKSK